jgi:hypothetical protein
VSIIIIVQYVYNSGVFVDYSNFRLCEQPLSLINSDNRRSTVYHLEEILPFQGF